MNEKENEAFRLSYGFYEKWRSVIIETDEQWEQFAKELCQLAVDMDSDHCPLAQHLFYAVSDTFSDLYRNGMKPVQANYFGRDDL